MRQWLFSQIMHDVSGPSGDAGEKSESPSEKCTARAGPVNFYLLVSRNKSVSFVKPERDLDFC